LKELTIVGVLLEHKPYYQAICRFDLSDPVADLKEKVKAIWGLGSYIDIATFLSPMSAHLVRAADVSRGEHVLDVACGTGITTITACRAGAKVIGIDLTPELLERAREEAAIAGLIDGIEWKDGDAEDLPFPDNSFDIVLSSLGHMFTPRPTVAAEELRVTKAGGRIAFTTWPPEHAVGRFFAAIGRHAIQNRYWYSMIHSYPLMLGRF
jgi:SAM-dependent methyltransferase